MTPEEAIAELVNTGILTTLASDAGVVRTLIDACVATAKATAKAAERQRCVAKVEELTTFIANKTLPKAKHVDTRGTVQGIINRLLSLRAEILHGAGLEPEK